jgi:hypothetical protein
VVVDTVLTDLDHVFDGIYASGGRRSVAPETLLKATVLMAWYSIRSERALLRAAQRRPAVEVVPGDGHSPGRLRRHQRSPRTGLARRRAHKRSGSRKRAANRHDPAPGSLLGAM